MMKQSTLNKLLKFWTLSIGIGAVWGAIMMWIDPTGKLWGMDPLLVDYCSTFVDQYNKNTGQNLTCCEYKEVLRKFFPSLKRWNLST